MTFKKLSICFVYVYMQTCQGPEMKMRETAHRMWKRGPDGREWGWVGLWI